MKRANRILKLNELLRHHQGYTIIELMAKLDVSDRTIYSDLNTVQRPPYNAVFWNEYRGKERLYRYKDTDFSLKLFEENNELKRKLNETIEAIEQYEGTPQYQWLKLCLMALENGSVSGLNSVMSFENNAYLEGLEHMEALAEAIVHKYPIKLTYKPYRAEEQMLYVHPYHLRQFNSRWFLIGKPEGTDNIHNYAIDRIVKVEHLSKKYIDTDIDFDEYFDDVIGVSVNDVETEHVVLMVSKKRYPYIKTKPLHWSQKHVAENDTDTEVCLTIDVKPNKELITLLLSFGPDIRLIAPDNIKQELINKIRAMYDSYL